MNALTRRGRPRPQVWRIAVWMVALVATIGALLYARHIVQTLLRLHEIDVPVDARNAAYVQMAWDVAYVLASALLLWLAAMTLNGRTWARSFLRVACVVVALWAAITGWGLWSGTADLRHTIDGALADPAMPDELRSQVQSILGALYLGIVVRVLAIPTLGWLAWRLGRPDTDAAEGQRRAV